MKPWLIRRKIAGWSRRNNTLMAQAVDLQRQLQEAWDERDEWKAHAEFDVEVGAEWQRKSVSLEKQLHRVARERDECYRQKRLSDMRHANTIKEMQSAIDEMLETIENEEE